jgi:ribosome-binding protein aMBF1 (putative translation factor)
MRCECCDKELNNEETTAKFAESGAYVGMCKKCQAFLPKGLKITTRSDLERYEAESFDSDSNSWEEKKDYGDEEDEE